MNLIDYILNYVATSARLLLEFIGTVYLIRKSAFYVRRFWSFPEPYKMRKYQSIFLYVAPSTLLSIYTWILSYYCPIISPTAAVVSILIDLIILFELVFYYRFISGLRRMPGRVYKIIYCTRIANNWMEQIKLLSDVLKRIGGSIIPFFRSDVRSLYSSDVLYYLAGDIRYIDFVEYPEDLNITNISLEDIPHFPLRKTMQDNEGLKSQEILKGITATRGSSYAVNRALNLSLPPELWQVSCNICTNTVFAAAYSWKRYHAQDSLRLRLVTLFNTADLIQRTMVIFLLAAERDKTTRISLRNSLAEGSFMMWNSVLRLLVEKTNLQRLSELKKSLLCPIADYDKELESLTPFFEVIGEFIPENDDNIAALLLLGHFRNRILGHGNIGAVIASDPIYYLKILHRYFLRVISNLCRHEFRIYALARGSQPAKIQESYRGSYYGLFKDNRKSENDMDSALGIIPGMMHVTLNPEMRFHQGRLLILNRVRPATFQYIDYNVENITEPSYLSFSHSDANEL